MHQEMHNVVDREASHPIKRATQGNADHFLFHSKLYQNQKVSAYYTIPIQSLPSREAETAIQNIIQDLSSGVEPSISKSSSAHRAPRYTVGHRLAGSPTTPSSPRFITSFIRTANY